MLDLLCLLDTALMDGRAVHYTATRKEAITLVSRLNKMRQRLREADAEGYSPYDEYVISLAGNRIEIVKRPNIDPTKIIHRSEKVDIS